jgi:putative thioredoxin
MQRPRYSNPASSYGVVDLSALRTPSPAPAAPTAAGTSDDASGTVIDVTEATFQSEILERSRQVPVVIDFWAEWCGPCKQLSPILERLANEYAGRFVLAKIDTDANQMLAQQFGIQSIPSVMAVVAGQLVPLFQGALPERQVRQFIDQLLALAAKEFGMGSADGAGADADAALEPPRDPALDPAYDALDRGDMDGAAQAFRNVLAADPANVEAKTALAQLELLTRTQGADPVALRAAADAKPDDVPAQLAAADVELATGAVENAFDRLVKTVSRTAGADRDQARVRLLEYFELLGPEDPRVTAGRSALMRVLF